MSRKAHRGKVPETPYEKLRSRLAARALADGKIKVPPISCSWCDSENVAPDISKGHDRDENGKPVLLCVTCGRTTTQAIATRLRRQKIRAIIAEGIDPPGLEEAKMQRAKTPT